MRSNFKFTPLVSALALAMSMQTNAAQPINVQNVPFSTLKNQFNLVVPGTLLKANQSTDSMTFIREFVDNNNVAHVRMQQQYAGFPVDGGYAIIHSAHNAQGLLAAQSAETTMNGTVYQGLKNELGAPAADFVANGQKVLEAFKSQYSKNPLSEDSVTPLVYMDDDNNAHWAYKVSVLVTHTDAIPARPTAIISAETGKTFIAWDDIKTKQLSVVKGAGFGGNNKAGQFEYNGGELPYLEFTRDSDSQKCYLETESVKIVNMYGKRSAKNIGMEFKCPDNDSGIYMTGLEADGYDKINGAFSPTNDAMYSGYVIKNMYLEWYGLNALEKKKKPMQLVMRVHYDKSYENAYWDGSKMTFGDGASTFYPLVSLGVAAHEISHGFTEQHSNLEYNRQSGGMNESFSDMAAQAAEYYSVKKNNWMIGSEIVKEKSGLETLRYMDVPSKDGRSIDRADQYRNNLDVHYSSGVYNRLFYLIATTEGWNTRTAFDVMVKANVAYWTPRTTFKEGACGVLQATLDEKRSLDDVKAALDKVVIDYSDCKLKPIPIPN